MDMQQGGAEDGMSVMKRSVQHSRLMCFSTLHVCLINSATDKTLVGIATTHGHFL